jgi:hypothetical protein
VSKSKFNHYLEFIARAHTNMGVRPPFERQADGTVCSVVPLDSVSIVPSLKLYHPAVYKHMKCDSAYCSRSETCAFFHSGTIGTFGFVFY